MKFVNNYSSLSLSQKKQVDSIFKDTSTVRDIEKLNILKHKYLDFYFDKLFIIAIKNEEVLGYICGMQDSSSNSELIKNFSYLSYFTTSFDDYPAHLHINMSPRAQGLGLGSKLITKFEELLCGLNIKGVHLITTLGSRNNSFYKKNGYSLVQSEKIGDSELILLGKQILRK